MIIYRVKFRNSVRVALMYIFYYINILQTYIFEALHFAGPCTSEQLAHPLARACHPLKLTKQCRRLIVVPGWRCHFQLGLLVASSH
jgi:hypothetical protein